MKLCFQFFRYRDCYYPMYDVFIRYGLDLNMERVEDVLLHQKILADAEDPDKRPIFHVRFMKVQKVPERLSWIQPFSLQASLQVLWNWSNMIFKCYMVSWFVCLSFHQVLLSLTSYLTLDRCNCQYELWHSFGPSKITLLVTREPWKLWFLPEGISSTG